MVEARATWVDEERFLGQASSGHGIVLDGAQVKSGNSPMELVLVGLCGCTAIDVVSILRKSVNHLPASKFVPRRNARPRHQPYIPQLSWFIEWEARFHTKPSKTQYGSQKKNIARWPQC